MGAGYTPRPMADVIEFPLPSLTPGQVLGAGEGVVIDLRTPAEFAEDHLPGAVNVPLFDNVQRAVIGTLYKQASPEEAFSEGRERALERIEGLVEEVARVVGWEVPSTDLRARLLGMTEEGIEGLERSCPSAVLDAVPASPVVLHCWRGGLRSRSVVAFMRGLGLDRAVALEGGYKAYRRHVVDELDHCKLPKAHVIRGLTGVGKTLVLRALEEIRPGWTLDLEGCAGHRSSLLGMVGLEPVSQKGFDSRIAERMRGRAAVPLVMEGESRKVGDVTIAPRVWGALDGGVNLLIETSTARRVEVLCEDYLAREDAWPLLREQLAHVGRMMQPRRELTDLFDTGRMSELVELLLEEWYDPRYRHGEGRRAYAATFDSTDPGECARRIVEWIEAREFEMEDPA